MFDCGDGNIVGWTEFLEGGEECKVKYMYTKVGNFYIKAKARDRTGGVSGWGDSTLVKIKAGKGVIWVVDHGGGEIIKLSKKGHFIRKTTIPEPFMVKVDPTDGSVWVVSTFISELRKLSYDGDLLIFKGYPDFPGKEDAKLPTTPCIDGEGNLWVTLSWVKLIVKLNKETGEVMKVIPDTVKMNYRHPVAIDIDKERNHIWVAEPHAVESTMGYISKIDANSGEIIWRKEGFQPAMVKVDQPNHICWITDPGNKRVVKMYPTGDYHVQTDGFSQPWSISIDEKNGQIWVGDKEGKKVVVLEETRMGKILEVKFNQEVGGVEVDPFTGECWVAVGEKVVKLSSTGEVTVEVDYPFIEAVHISINPNVDPE
jgi:streptogramin lyase